MKRELIESIRLDKISAALYGLRPRYLAHDLVARILSISITIIITSYYCDSNVILRFFVIERLILKLV